MMKIHADEADCLDINGEPGIQTSMGSAPLEWGEDECVAWVSTLEGSGSAAHWAAGVWDPPTCRFVDQRIWTVTNTVDGLLVRLVDSVDGSVVDSVVGSLPGDGFIDGRDMTVDLDNNPPSSESTRTTS